MYCAIYIKMEAKEKLRINMLVPNNLLSLTFSFNSSFFPGMCFLLSLHQ